jgi:hypothetical protein
MQKKSKAQRVKERLAQLVKQYVAEMDPHIPMGIHAPPPMELDGQSEWDGTAGFDSRPDFVREDDERTGG